MTRHFAVPINVFLATMALQVALCGVLLGLMALRWPVAAGVVLALAVCVVMWVAIVKVVTSGHRPLPKPVCDAGATVDGRAVESVEVMQP